MSQVKPNLKVAVIGLGYVGLPLAIEFGKRYETIGFDINQSRISELARSIDSTREVDADEFSLANKLSFSDQEEALLGSDFFVVTVPTPITEDKRPDLTALIGASQLVGRVIQKDAIVIYESTVYPGCTEEECVPVVEKISGYTANKDFFYGYSPERINPGDKTRRLPDIVKVTSGSSGEAATLIDSLYSSIIIAGTHKASSVKVAEAAKVIENTQRDINIGLINELAMIFNKMEIDTTEVLEAAGTKWNFLPFRPGLVGGHCISVDPYYLTYKARQLGHRPELILAGRRVNDHMGEYVATTLVKSMIQNNIDLSKSKILVMGFTFKENCPDIRNSRVVDIIHELTAYTKSVDIYDPHVEPNDVYREYGLKTISKPEFGVYDAVVLAVAHDEFRDLGAGAIRCFGNSNSILYDLKNVFDIADSDIRL